MDFSLLERSSRAVSVSQSQAHFIPIYEIAAKARSTKKTTDRQCLEKLMRIRHACLSKEERKSVSVCLFEKKKKITIKITKGVSLFYFDKKERAVSDSVS